MLLLYKCCITKYNITSTIILLYIITVTSRVLQFQYFQVLILILVQVPPLHIPQNDFKHFMKLWTITTPAATHLFFFNILWNFERKKGMRDADPKREASSHCELCNQQRTEDYKHWFTCPTLAQHAPAFDNDMHTSWPQFLTWIQVDCSMRLLPAMLYSYAKWVVYTRWLKGRREPHSILNHQSLLDIQQATGRLIHSTFFLPKYTDKVVALQEFLDRNIQWKNPS